MNVSQALHWYPKEHHHSLQLLASRRCVRGINFYVCSNSDTDHDFAQFVSFGPDVVHEHLVGSELVLDGQRVVLTLLHLLQLDSFTKVPHHLNPESSLMGEAKGSMRKGM